MSDSGDPDEELGSDTSLSLLRRVQAKNREAWERLVNLYSPLVYRWARLAGLPAAEAADVGQEVFRTVSRNISDFELRPAGDSFRVWLRTIARNKIRDYYRRHPPKAASALQPQQGPSPADPSGLLRSDPVESRMVCQRALELIHGEFEEQTWQAFWDTTVEGIAPDKIAERMSVPLNVVYLARSRVLRRLRHEFGELIELNAL